MASCFVSTIRNLPVCNQTSGSTCTITVRQLDIPVITATTTPNTCVNVLLTGADYQALLTKNTSQDAQIQTNVTNIASNTTTSNTALSSATAASTSATNALQKANDALAQTNALANITTGLNTFNQVFNIPNSTMLGQAWALGFILPMTIGLICFAVAKLVNFWDSPH